MEIGLRAHAQILADKSAMPCVVVSYVIRETEVDLRKNKQRFGVEIRRDMSKALEGNVEEEKSMLGV